MPSCPSFPTRPNPGPPATYGRIASTLEEKSTRWFWEPWIAYDMLNLVVGGKNVGKSSLAAWLMARARRPVILPGYEEDVERMQKPRWRAHGVKQENLLVLNDQPYFPSLQIDLFVKILRDHQADLFVVEIIDSYLPADASENDAQAVRPFLESFNKIAERAGVAVVATRHPGKDAENVFRGSQAWENVCRNSITMEKHEGPPLQRWMFSHHCGVAEQPPAITFELRREGKTPPVFIPGQDADKAVVEVAKAVPDKLDRFMIDQAKNLLRELLATDEQLASFVLEQGRREGLGERTMQRAANMLGVVRRREGKGQAHKIFWQPPPAPPTPDTPG